MNWVTRIVEGALYLCVTIAIVVCFAFHYTATLAVIKNQPLVWGVNESSWDVEPVIEVLNESSQAWSPNLKFHVAVTAMDSTYSRWQCRIMYYWFNRVKDLPGSDMGGFTRILHSGEPDNLMQDIPSFVVEPLPHGLDQGYLVLNRPWAFVQWLEKATIEEEYILMAETNHLFVNPLPNLAAGKNPTAYPFSYIEPDKNEKIVRKFYPKGSILNVDPIGSSPVIISKSLLKEIAPTWKDISSKIRNDPEADSTFDMVQEMYAYAIASALHCVKHNLQKDFMIQPSNDWDIGNSYIIHNTYACDYNNKEELIYGQITDWHFDKRMYQEVPPPNYLTLLPPGAPVTVVRLIEMVNEAAANIPDWEDL